MQFTRLRLSGFKSFVDPAELRIEPGLTGVVGPNGCGKSNLLEALRWVMGETSARLIRGAEMDDVIFAGAAGRPARNLAEVVLVLDNGERRAPAAFNDTDELEISRRIERESGSAYRINGKEVRARDVQTLFADAAAGARSPALVGQGRIGAIINAKPADRRHILEEAAGIGGIQSRRHEAESRLKATEANLERLEDVAGQLSLQLNGLKRQSRQASRYRNVQAEIRQSEAIILHLRWLKAQSALEAARADLDALQGQVAAATGEAARAMTRENDAAEALPALHEAQAKAAAELHRLIVARDGLILEERRAQEALARARATLETLAADAAREEGLLADARAAVARLDGELAELAAAADGADLRAEGAARAESDAAAVLAQAEAALDAAQRDVAAAEARRGVLDRDLADGAAKLAQAARRREDLLAEIGRVEAARAAAPAAADLAQAVETAAGAFEAARTALDAAEAELLAATAAEQAAREALARAEAAAAQALRTAEDTARNRLRQAEQEAATALREAEAAAQQSRQAAEREAAEAWRAAQGSAGEALRRAQDEAAAWLRQAQGATAERLRELEGEAAALAAEEKALNAALSGREGDAWPPVIDLVKVERGYEAALGAALSEDLDVPVDAAAPAYWRELDPLPAPPWPEGVAPLAPHVEAPAALRRRLERVGIVADGDALQGGLQPGQILVSPAGAVWRWDGLRAAAGAAGAAGLRLAQRNRLDEVAQARARILETLETARREAEAAVEAAREQGRARVEDARQAGEATLAQARAAGEARVAKAREDARIAVAHVKQEHEKAVAEARAAAATATQEARAGHEPKIAAAREAWTQAQQAARGLRDGEAQRRRFLRETQEALSAAQETQARVARETATLDARAEGLAAALARLADETAALDETVAAVRAQAQALPPRETLETERAQKAGTMEAARAALAQARTEREGLAAAGERRQRRRTEAAAEREAWSARLRASEEQRETLAARSEAARREEQSLDGTPEDAQQRRAALQAQVEEAEAARKAAADALALAETELREARTAAREAEAQAGARREARARAEAGLEQATARRAELGLHIQEEMDCKPQAILQSAGIEPDRALPELADIEARLERLRRERDQMGPVNLRAEMEVEEIETRMGEMGAEREDLTAAIAKLRGSIASLNREGRERLHAAFEQVNVHFTALFTRLFGGGRAHLALTQSDDPLDVGLEIYASPPGKKLQVLSLLSGGEQALTALSLIFAVFMVTPSPVCVLDEVDAPLDDANVVRFCDLCEEVARDTGTRFLVVTHHAVTMQRMDRLYGVTMAEAGVSQLVSVDLSRAPELLAAE